MPSFLELLATALFAIAVIHTFSVPVFARLANKGGPHAGLWHLLSEVEAVFGVWACVLIACMALFAGVDEGWRKPLAGTRPIWLRTSAGVLQGP